MESDMEMEKLKEVLEKALREMNLTNALFSPIKKKPSYRMRSNLANRNVKELRYIVEEHTGNSKSNWNKETLINVIEEELSDEEGLECCLRLASFNELFHFLEFASEKSVVHDKPFLADFLLTGRINTFLELGCLFEYEYEGEYRVVVPTEIRRLLTPLSESGLINCLLEQKMVDVLARAAVNLYGIISLPDFRKLILEVADIDLSVDVIENALDDVFEETDAYVIYKNELVHSFFTEQALFDKEIDWNIELFKKQLGVKQKRYMPSLEVFLDCQDSMNLAPQREVNSLFVFLARKLGLDEDATRKMIQGIIVVAHLYSPDSNFADMFQSLVEMRDLPKYARNKKKINSLFQDICRHTPHWILKGHKPSQCAFSAASRAQYDWFIPIVDAVNLDDEWIADFDLEEAMRGDVLGSEPFFPAFEAGKRDVKPPVKKPGKKSSSKIVQLPFGDK